MELIQVSLSTNNLEKLKEFYVNVFDFLPYSTWEKPNDGLKAVKLIRNEILLEITESSKLVVIPIPFSLNKQGLNMLGFIVKDIQETIAKAENFAGKIHQAITPGVTVKEIAFITDPDGNGIELIAPHSANPQKLNLTVSEYDRSVLWSTANITSDLQALNKYFLNGLWNTELGDEVLHKAVLKAGDICGCPIPDKVALREGEIGAFNYLIGLSQIYNDISDIINDLNSPILKEWGKTETRDIVNEPAGEDASRLPEDIVTKGIVRGPGKYQEFSITRLLWIDKQEKNMVKKVGLNKIKLLLAEVKTLDELQVSLIAEIAEQRINKEPIEELISTLVKGIAHEGFFKQNNSYIQVRRVRDLLEEKYASKQWYTLLAAAVERVLSLPITKYS